MTKRHRVKFGAGATPETNEIFNGGLWVPKSQHEGITFFFTEFKWTWQNSTSKVNYFI